MKTRVIAHVFCAIVTLCLLAGCQSPMERALQRHPNWLQTSQHMILDCRDNASGLDRVPFPDLNNPLHREIWDALYKKDKMGEGFGTICNYYGFYLVNLHDDYFANHSFFYEPTNRLVIKGDETTAGLFYGGDRTANVSNVLRFVRYITDVSAYRTFLITNADQIPHSRYASANPEQPINDLLLSKGVLLVPPNLVPRKNVNDYESTECSVFVYEALGGEVLRYDVECRDGKIRGFAKYKLVSGVGDFWLLM